MALFLFLFFAEAMIAFLTDDDIDLHGLCIQFSSAEVKEAEFADNIVLYLHGNLGKLHKAELALSTFCKASGALVNWNKSMALWVINDDPPLWKPHPQLPRGTPIHYLGCTIGIDLSSVNQVAPLLMTLRNKLFFWSLPKLSFAGRIIVANQVLLATTWYVLSCWIFS